jgi:transposase
MRLTDHPDDVIPHRPGRCRGCGHRLGEDAVQTGMERRQVIELPEKIRAKVAEHRMLELECPCCGERTKADAPAGVPAPVQYAPRAAAMAA